jgi:dihydroorotate dehydrogenase
MYKIAKTILFQFDAEKVHHFVMKMLLILYKLPFGKYVLQTLFDSSNDGLSKNIFGLNFKNPIGLAAGFDKNGKYIDELAALGFGFIEVGTVTPKAQTGNVVPRLFRLPEDEAIINRMGFNNDGVDSLVEHLKKVKNKEVIIGGNIGKNKDTPNENAIDDYVVCFEKLYNYVDYFVINVSSPNTPGLRALQEKEPLTRIINAMVEKRAFHEKQKPILLKIAPDLSEAQLDEIIEITEHTKLDGLVISNTTLSRTGLKSGLDLVERIGQGGLSGKPILERSNHVLKYVASKTNKPIIGVGGIHDEKDMKSKISNGAALIQIYTGFVYEGPAIVKRLKMALLKENN